MRKLLVVLTALIVVFKAPFPVPGQTAHPSSGDANKHTSKASKGQQRASQVPLAVGGVTPASATGKGKPNQDKADGKSDNNSLMRFIPVSVKRDGFDWALVIVNVLLLIVGGFGVCAAIKNIGALKTQIGEMRKATWQTAKHISLIERPWISISTQPDGPIFFDERGMHIKFAVSMSNVGKSPAKVVSVITHAVMLKEGLNIDQYRDQFIERCKRGQEQDTVLVVFPGDNDIKREISLIVGAKGLHTMTDEDLLYPYMFVCVRYRSTIDENARPISFYTYLLRKAVTKGSAERLAGISVGDYVPADIVRIIPDSQRFGPIAE